ncbi:MAG: copper amine oxidase N-terminal domain-containing protein, partial [Anaerotignum sp.]|nr:copper amine oxidase N-terminal domain-containing protein [Anaerotignum sp.]
GVETSPNWLDYAESSFEEDADYIQLTAKQAVSEKPVQKPEDPVVSPLNEYKIVIGSADIVKNGKVSYTSDVVPYLNKDGYTMLPLRALLEVSNPEQKVTWNNGTKSAHTFVNNKLISIRPHDPVYTKETESIALRTPAETVNGRLFVSLRDWMNIMEIDVSQINWDAPSATVTLKY